MTKHSVSASVLATNALVFFSTALREHSFMLLSTSVTSPGTFRPVQNKSLMKNHPICSYRYPKIHFSSSSNFGITFAWFHFLSVWMTGSTSGTFLVVGGKALTHCFILHVLPVIVFLIEPYHLEPGVISTKKQYGPSVSPNVYWEVVAFSQYALLFAKANGSQLKG